MLRLLGEDRPAPPAAPRAPESHWTPTRLAINLLLRQPSLALEVGRLDDIAEADIAGIDLLLRLLDTIQDDPGIRTAALLDRFRGDAHENHLYRLAAMEPPVADDDSLQRMFADCLQQLQKQYIDHRRKRLIAKLQAGDALSEAEKREHRQLFSGRA